MPFIEYYQLTICIHFSRFVTPISLPNTLLNFPDTFHLILTHELFIHLLFRKSLTIIRLVIQTSVAIILFLILFISQEFLSVF